jgi:hypothetical protein
MGTDGGNAKSVSVNPHVLISPWHSKSAVEGSRSSHLRSEGKWCLRLETQFLPPIPDSYSCLVYDLTLESRYGQR